MKTHWGVGLGLRAPHIDIFRDLRPSSVQWLEVISENYLPRMDHSFPRAIDSLLEIRQHYPLALHGVSMNLGSADPVDEGYLQKLKDLIALTEPIFVSDHLSWTGVDGLNSHDLLPLPYNQETLDHCARKIDAVQNKLQRALLIENPSTYLEWNHDDRDEVGFITELLKITGARLLLDINNVFVNSVNHGFDPKVYLDRLPRDLVAQIHLAGPSDRKGFLVDTHDTPVPSEVWDLYQHYISGGPLVPVMIERDGHIPEWSELEKEIFQLRALNEDAVKNKESLRRNDSRRNKDSAARVNNNSVPSKELEGGPL